MENRMRIISSMIVAINILTLVSCSSVKTTVIQTPTKTSTQTPTEICFWVYTNFTLDTSSLGQGFNSADIIVSDLVFTGNGEGGNCSTGYGNAALVLSFSVDDANAKDEEALGKLLETVVD